MVTIGAVALLMTGSFMGADHPSGMVHNAGWPKEIHALVNSPQRVHGYFVNWEDVFFFRGDSATFNKFLANYASVAGVGAKLVIHKGHLKVRSPWDKQDRKIKANWQLYTNTLQDLNMDSREAERTRVDVWLDGSLKREKLVIPKNVQIETKL